MTDLLQLLARFEKEAECHERYYANDDGDLLDVHAGMLETRIDAGKRILLLCKVMRIAAQDLQSAHNITQDTRLRNFLRESLERIQGLMRNEK